MKKIYLWHDYSWLEIKESTNSFKRIAQIIGVFLTLWNGIWRIENSREEFFELWGIYNPFNWKCEFGQCNGVEQINPNKTTSKKLKHSQRRSKRIGTQWFRRFNFKEIFRFRTGKVVVNYRKPDFGTCQSCLTLEKRWKKDIAWCRKTRSSIVNARLTLNPLEVSHNFLKDWSPKIVLVCKSNQFLIRNFYK